MSQPYLSIVATSRNDDHGSNMLRRMQTFVNALIGQCRRHGLHAELILVEWNPPADRPRLAQALHWPAETHPCEVRIIEVPPALHNRLDHARALPLFQMIAKNAGIRRARGKFVLATNIDILFSDELVEFLVRGGLQYGRMYRIDRHDVMTDVPVDAPVEEQLVFCRSHLLRVNMKTGTRRLTPEGQQLFPPDDVFRPENGIRLGEGWLELERHHTDPAPYRWAEPGAELHLRAPEKTPAVLSLKVEQGPGVRFLPFHLEVEDRSGRKLFEERVVTRQWVQIPLKLKPGQSETIRLRARNGGRAWYGKPYIVDFRVFEAGWNVRPRETAPPLSIWRRLRKIAGRVKRTLLALDPRPVRAPSLLHTNACGDFTLMAREHWFELRGHPEMEIFSLHLDSLMCYMAHHGGAVEEILPEPMRIYHIEHGTGSGWTPEGEAKLLARLAEKGIPVLDHDKLMKWATRMRTRNETMVFNDEHWGFARETLPETIVGNPALKSHAA